MVTTALEKVRIELTKKRVRIEDQFSDFDRLHCGAITPDQFKRCLAIAVSLNHVTEADAAELARRYATSDGLLVNYKAFMADVNAEEVPHAVLSPTRTGRTLCVELEAALNKMTDFFVHRIKTTGLDVRQCFRDFDRHNCGKITIAQFERSFPFKVEPRFLKAIEEKYTDGNGNILYLAWCNDVVSAASGTGSSGFAAAAVRSPAASYASEMAKRHESVDKEVDVERLLAELRANLAAKRLRVDDQLRDYDKLHTGLVTKAQFCACLGRLPLNRMVLQESELAALASRYATVDATGETKVLYRGFLDDVDQLLHPVPAMPVLSDNTLSPEEELQVSAILDRVRIAIRTRRVNIKPTFKDFDRAAKGIYQSRSCTRTRFERALAVNMINLSPAEVTLLEKKYAMVRADGTLEDDINYHSFCTAVDLGDSTPEPLPPRGTTGGGASSPGSVGRRSGSKSLREVLDKVMLQAVDRRVRLTEFMRDFDPLHSGAIPNGKLASALTISGLQLTQDDLEVIFLGFPHETLPQHVNLAQFLREVDTGVVVDNHESPARPARDNEQELKQRLHVTDEGAAGDQAGQLTTIVSRVSETVRSRGILLPPFFLDYDKHHSGRITRAQFVQVLSRHRLPLSQSDVDLLCKVYADPIDPQQVRYRGFIGAVDESENVRKQHALRSTMRATATAAGPGTASSLRGSQQSAPAGADADATLRKIADIVRRRSARIEEFFHDNDPLRSGSVSAAKFRTDLDMTGVHLSEAEHVALASRFRSERVQNAVNYVSFCRAVEAIPVSSLGEVRPTVAANGIDGLDPFTQRVLDKVRQQLESRRLVSRPLFQDSDKLRKGTVTEAQFFSTLTTINVRFTPIEADAVRKIIKTSDGMMGYLRFCQLADPSM